MTRLAFILITFSLIGGTAWAQAPQDDPDMDLSVAQPDFTLAAMPTTLRLPRFKSSFRVTHRFGRPLGAGDFGDLAGDLFGLDSGAQIGLEYRFGVMRGLQAGIRRTSDKTIEFTASEAGTFPILCSLFCGDGHNDMKGALVVTARAAASK